MKIREVLTPKLLQELLRNLLERNARSIFLNCLPGNYRSRIELSSFDDARRGSSAAIIDWLLNNTDPRFTFDLTEKNQEKLVSQEELLLKRKLENLIVDDKEKKQNFGISSLSFGYPILRFQRPEENKVVTAPLFIWSLEIKKNPDRVNSFQICRAPEPPALNDALIFLLEEEFGVTRLAGNDLRDTVTLDSLESLTNLICSKLNFDKPFAAGDVTPKLTPNSEVKEAHWVNTGVLALYDQSKGPIISVMRGLMGKTQEGPTADLKPEIDYSRIHTAISVDPSQDNMFSHLRGDKNVIIQGPPGTGKSRSLASLMTAVLASGGRCLVVCEKDTALDVLVKNLTDGKLAICSKGMLLKIQDVKAERVAFADKVYEALALAAEMDGGEYTENDLTLEEAYSDLAENKLRIDREKAKLYATVLSEHKHDKYRDVIGEYLHLRREFPSIPRLELSGSIDHLVHFDTTLTLISELDNLFHELLPHKEALKDIDIELIRTLNPIAEREFYRRVDALDEVIQRLSTKLNELTALGVSNSRIPASLTVVVLSLISKKYKSIRALLEEIAEAVERVDRELPDVLGNPPDVKLPIPTSVAKELAEFSERRLADLRAAKGSIYKWKDFRRLLDNAGRPIQELFEKLSSDKFAEQSIPWRAILENAVYEDTLSAFSQKENPESGKTISKWLKEVRDSERELSRLNNGRLNAGWRQRVSGLPRREDWKATKFKLTQKKASRTRGPRRSIHQLFQQHLDEILTLFPVVLTNPVTAAVLFGTGSEMFDIIIYDEASQLRLEDTLTSALYAKRVVVSGDRHQMPPVDFFAKSSKTAIDDDNEDDDVFEEDADLQAAVIDFYNNLHLAESLLDFAYALKDSLFQELMLTCHYRSEHPDLINFSNHAFYGGRLLPLPSVLEYVPIEFIEVNGTYYPTPDRYNPAEADEVIRLLKSDKIEDTQSVGIATLNLNQRNLIYDKLNAARELDSDFDEKMTRLEGNGLFIKNLVNIQGDERDIIVLSCTYGTTVSNTSWSHFGPVSSSKNGYKLLNVLVTRAKHKVFVLNSVPHHDYSSFPSLRGEKTSLISGRAAFYAYLAYAKAVSNSDAQAKKEILNSIATNAAVRYEGEGRTNSHSESPFEEEVYVALTQHLPKSRVVQQYQAGGFRIDMVVLDEKLRRPILAVECDGAKYHSSLATHAWDIYRQQELEHRLSITFHRIWSTDWWRNCDGELSMLLSRIEKLDYAENPIV